MMLRTLAVHVFTKHYVMNKQEISSADRLIVALDVATQSDALSLVEELGDSVHFYKIGMELLTSGAYFSVLETLVKLKKKVFVDLKFFDVPATVAAAIKGLTRYPVTFATIHGNHGMVKAAVAEKKHIKLLAVTALTSLDQQDLNDLGFSCDIQTLVVSRARAAMELGCDGIVSSGLEVPVLRQALASHLCIVCPGIRPIENTDDQKRTVNVQQAFSSGADYVVIGRPIRQAKQPRIAAQEVQNHIAAIFNK